jgi:4-aminobutyrate aminotransferase / (S)-3-amino-2-methylpropionate transaminase / 5-aminovalerate transaminase
MRVLDLASAAQHIESVMMPRLQSLGSPAIGDVRGRGAMLAVELVEPGTSGPFGPIPSPATAAAIAKKAHEAGLLLLTCGTYGNVVRFLPPLVISDDELERGLAILSDAFA